MSHDDFDFYNKRKLYSRRVPDYLLHVNIGIILKTTTGGTHDVTPIVRHRCAVFTNDSGGVFAAPAVKILSYEEAQTEANESKPRIYIQNISPTEAISNFYCYYYFTVENNKTPVLTDYYTPTSVPALEPLGNGNYRVKLTFLNQTLQPGQILPNTSGELVGIRYSDFSPLDKTNDHSNNLSREFVINAKITVYTQSGTQIYGNIPPNPANPPQPPVLTAATGDFAVFSKEYTSLRENVTVSRGDAGSVVYTELGCDDVLYGNVYTLGSVLLRDRVKVYGAAAAGQTVSLQNAVLVQNGTRNLALMELPVLTTPVVATGTASVDVPPNGTYTLTPGSYNTFRAYANVNLTILPGVYNFRQFILEPNVRVLVNCTPGSSVVFNVMDHSSFGNGCIMSLPAGVTSGYPFALYSSQTSQLYLGTDAQIKGLFYAPDAEVHVYSRTQVAGSLFGKRVVLEPQVTVCKPPALLGLSHSEGAMAPPFDPIRFSYVAVVPDVTSTITVIPVAAAGHTVKVNGNDPSYPVNLTGDETDINVLLSHPEACGSTEYKLKVKRSANAALYVNPKSTCPAAQQDGTTWQTAFSSLTVALDRAAAEGKELRLAEGVYTPTERLNPDDPRSKSFIVRSGMEIIGGFTGEETDGKPSGDPKKTIITGDVNGDDSSITAWPPVASQVQFADDNAYHVITIVGNSKSADISLENLVVTHGNANGTGLNGVAGGVHVQSGKPKFTFVGFIDNYAKMGGGGMQVNEGAALGGINNCLFQNNYALTGSGGGLSYLSASPFTVDGSVFDGNTTGDTASVNGGSALFTKKAKIEFVNTVFAQNKSASSKGAVLNDGGTVNFENCTFAYNTSTGAVSICNVNTAKSWVMNSILWNSSAKDEVSGGNSTVLYSTITKGHTGSGNLTGDPKFIDPAKPAGKNGMWGDFDDGVRLTAASPCRESGYMYHLETDILTIDREVSDQGAYTYVYTNVDGVLGKILNGVFAASVRFDVVDEIRNSIEIMDAIDAGYSHDIEVEIPKNKYTDRKNTVLVKAFGLDENGVKIGNEVPVMLYRVGSSQTFRSYIASPGGTTGKCIIFVKNMGGKNAAGGEHYLAYLIRASENGKVKITLDKEQFN